MSRLRHERPRGAAGRFPDLQTAFREAVLLHQSGRPDKALKIYRGILKTLPGHPEALNLAGLALCQTGQMQRGVKALREAVAAKPDFADAHLNLGVVLQQLGRIDEAERAYRRVTDLMPGRAEGHFNLANVLQLSGERDEAIAAYRRAIARDPNFGYAYANMAGLLIESGEARAALAACDRALALLPGNRGALSDKCVALLALGARDELRRLIDFERFLYRRRVEAPPGFADLAAFNAALAKHVLDHPSLRFEPGDKTTRAGKQTGNLLEGRKGPVAALEGMIRQAVAEYVRALLASAKPPAEPGPAEPAHPYVANIPDLPSLNVWGTVLGRQGHQAPHIHRDGWVSGVYYVRLPEVVRRAGESRVGWIEFGRPPEKFNCRAEPEARLMEPEEGVMYLFPSYLYHRTIPFKSDEPRISIAFDAMA